MRNRPIYDVVALLARCGVGTVFLAHGWQKIQVGVNAFPKLPGGLTLPYTPKWVHITPKEAAGK